MNRKATSPIPPQAVATEKDIEDFDNGIGDGPTQQLFKLQFPAHITPWNDRATEVALAYMKEQSKMELHPDKEMEQFIKSHISYLGQCYKKQLRMQDPGAPSLTNEDTKKLSSRDQRRRNVSLARHLFLRGLIACSYTVAESGRY